MRNKHHGPLYVQKPFYPEGPELAHVYLLHPPGGMVSGDSLAVGLNLEQNAQVLLTTPGAGRVYRARLSGRLQHQQLLAALGPASSLEYLPQEMIVFPGAQARIDTRFDLTENSRLIAWDICSLGLPVSDKSFSNGSLCLRFGIYRDGVPLLLDHLSISDQSRPILQSRIGWQGYPVGALMVAGPFPEPSRQVLEDTLSTVRARLSITDGQGLCAASSMNGFIVVRSLARNVLFAKAQFESAWHVLRPALLNRQVVAPRIWAT